MKQNFLNRRLLSLAAVLLVASVTVVASEPKTSSETKAASELDLAGVKCVVAPKDVQASKSADYKDAKVYFCCGGCAGKFAANEKKYATQANRQLVQSKQFEQTGCPMSGNKVNPETMITVDGVKVGFCCEHCQAKAESADAKAKSDMIFGTKAFKKGFQKKAKAS
ncbi:YHS domain-containing protein [Neorhodopirellula lusitana]|uniref:YHS domain-containing protein n=1 Tax=Neorhodopirellula lusitana TaxID=445327 RepID=A0ABY1QCK3_9BACT|nr:YHS domain-containing protein [Neorhodopirellula lusitana]SMP65381.1 YHS domain-containing protein [Neorhodopirellula lusitana]